jgi:serine/threonine protein kinase
MRPKGSYLRMIGQTLGHYHIFGKIGEGGMGVVYRAHDEQLDRDVAIKILPPGLLGDESARKRFRKEPGANRSTRSGPGNFSAEIKRQADPLPS